MDNDFKCNSKIVSILKIKMSAIKYILKTADSNTQPNHAHIFGIVYFIKFIITNFL